jgi:hypothetical protein
MRHALQLKCPIVKNNIRGLETRTESHMAANIITQLETEGHGGTATGGRAPCDTFIVVRL